MARSARLEKKVKEKERGLLKLRGRSHYRLNVIQQNLKELLHVTRNVDWEAIAIKPKLFPVGGELHHV